MSQVQDRPLHLYRPHWLVDRLQTILLSPRQIGQLHALSRSQPYWHYRDRVATPVELIKHQGWPDDMKVNTLADAVEGWPKELGGTLNGAKRARRQPVKQTTIDSALLDMAGNMMCIPDLAMVWYSTVVSIKSDAWERDPPTYAEVCNALGRSMSRDALDMGVEHLSELAVPDGDDIDLCRLDDYDGEVDFD